MIYVCLFPYLVSFVEGPLKSMAYTLMFSAQTLAVFCGDLLGGALPDVMPSYAMIILIPGVTMAAVAVMRIWDRVDAVVQVQLPGGKLDISWTGPGHPVWMTGPATTVFEGEWNDE